MSAAGGIKFEKPVWFTCDHALEVTNADRPLTTEPDDWPTRGSGASARKAQEEVMETILSLNLALLTGERLRFLFRGGDYWGIQDITAIDNLGRLHLFELKRDRVKCEVPEQLGAYLLGSLFESAENFLARMWDLNRERLTANRWLLYLAAALINERTSNLGRHIVNDFHPDVRDSSEQSFKKASWNRLQEAERRVLRAEALHAKAVDIIPEPPVIEQLQNWSERIYDRLTRKRPTFPRVRARSQVVIWLVGRGFQEGALERARLWRRAGIDARVLELDVRQSKESGRWLVAATRERFRARDLLLDEVAGVQARIEANETAHELDLAFYDQRPPSDTKLDEGGHPKFRAARIVVRDEFGKEVQSIPPKSAADE